jgi:hypothetical protein
MVVFAGSQPVGDHTIATEPTDDIGRSQSCEIAQRGQAQANQHIGQLRHVEHGERPVSQKGRGATRFKDSDRPLRSPDRSSGSRYQTSGKHTVSYTDTYRRSGRQGRPHPFQGNVGQRFVATKEPGWASRRESDQARTGHLDPWCDVFQRSGDRLEQPRLPIEITVEDGQLGASPLGLSAPLPLGHPNPPSRRCGRHHPIGYQHRGRLIQRHTP